MATSATNGARVAAATISWATMCVLPAGRRKPFTSNDRLFGGNGDDVLTGGNGLHLDAGAKTARGGTGSHRFLIESVLLTDEPVPGDKLIVDFARRGPARPTGAGRAGQRFFRNWTAMT
jgi:hypothetical protein